MSTQTQAMTVEVKKLISAPVERVYQAWTDPTQLSKWFGCSKVVNLQVELDLRVDGQYRMDAETCENNKAGLVTGTYKEIVPNKKLVFTWNNDSQEFPANDTLVTVEFIDKGKSTEVVIKHTRFQIEKTAQAHNMGWSESLDKLSAYLA